MMLALGVDTCGPSGSVALARVGDDAVELLGQTELAGRSYSATLVAAIGALLAGAGTETEKAGCDCCRARAGEFYRRARRPGCGEGAG